MADAKNTDIVLKWYVVRAISGKERKILDYIENEIKRLNIRIEWTA